MLTRIKAWTEIFRGGVFLVLVSVGVPFLLTDAVSAVAGHHSSGWVRTGWLAP
jgi:hypothetical protein